MIWSYAYERTYEQLIIYKSPSCVGHINKYNFVFMLQAVSRKRFAG